MTNVVVARRRTIHIASNATAGFIDTTTPVTLKPTPSLTVGGASRLDHLQDVNSTGEANGATLIYDSNTDTYVVQKMTFSNIDGDIDGGTF